MRPVVVDVERAAENLLRCPIGCAFLALVDAIGSPADWHRLCFDHPSPVLTRQGDPTGEGVLATYWQAVARDWDGVHLTFLGLVTAPFVRIEGTAGASMLWSWDTEGTLWLRPELLQPVEDPIPLAGAEDPTYRAHGGRRFSGPLFSLADFDANDPSMVLLQPGRPRHWSTGGGRGGADCGVGPAYDAATAAAAR